MFDDEDINEEGPRTIIKAVIPPPQKKVPPLSAADKNSALYKLVLRGEKKMDSKWVKDVKAAIPELGAVPSGKLLNRIFTRAPKPRNEATFEKVIDAMLNLVDESFVKAEPPDEPSPARPSPVVKKEPKTSKKAAAKKGKKSKKAQFDDGGDIVEHIGVVVPPAARPSPHPGASMPALSPYPRPAIPRPRTPSPPAIPRPRTPSPPASPSSSITPALLVKARSPPKSPVRVPVRSPPKSPVRVPVRSPPNSPVRVPARSPPKSPVRVPLISLPKSPVRSPSRSPLRVPERVDEVDATQDFGNESDESKGFNSKLWHTAANWRKDLRINPRFKPKKDQITALAREFNEKFPGEDLPARWLDNPNPKIEEWMQMLRTDIQSYNNEDKTGISDSFKRARQILTRGDTLTPEDKARLTDAVKVAVKEENFKYVRALIKRLRTSQTARDYGGDANKVNKGKKVLDRMLEIAEATQIKLIRDDLGVLMNDISQHRQNFKYFLHKLSDERKAKLSAEIQELELMFRKIMKKERASPEKKLSIFEQVVQKLK
jgi:hypothetical protein